MEEIAAWLADGSITEDWYVWREGLSSWARIGDLKEFSPGSSSPPLPGPPAIPGSAPSTAAYSSTAGSTAGRGASTGPALKPRPERTAPPRVSRPVTGGGGKRGRTKAASGGGFIGLALIILAVAGGGYFLYTKQQETRTFRSSTGDFTVTLPGTHPNVETITGTENMPGLPPINHTTEIAERSPLAPYADVYFFLMVKIDFPPTVPFEIDGGLSGGLSSIGCRATELRDVEHEGRRGREADFSGTVEGTPVWGRAWGFRTRNGMIVIAGGGESPESMNDPAFREFFESFHIE